MKSDIKIRVCENSVKSLLRINLLEGITVAKAIHFLYSAIENRVKEAD